MTKRHNEYPPTPPRTRKRTRRRANTLRNAVNFVRSPGSAAARAAVKVAASHFIKKAKMHKNSANVGVKEVEGHVGGTVTKSTYHEFPSKKHNPKIMAKMIAPETYYFNDKFSLSCGSGA